MKGSRFAIVLLVATAAVARAGPGEIAGTVLDPHGEPVEHAPIRVFDAARGVDERSFSSEDGRYEIKGLAPGSYTVAVAMPCCSFEPYSHEVTLPEAADLVHDITLTRTDFSSALADDPGTLAGELFRRREVPDDEPVPRAHGRPDLSGIWLVEDDPFPAEPEPLEWAAKAARERDPNDLSRDPFARCLPGELPIPSASNPILTKLVQTPDLLIMLFEGAPGFRQVFLDGREHPAKPNPSWLGHSVGRWEDDTLVVDTVGFNTDGVNGGYDENVDFLMFPRSEKMRVEERYTRTEYGYMQVRLTIDDPGVFSTPWVKNLHLDLVPQEEMIEFVCENNKWIDEAKP